MSHWAVTYLEPNDRGNLAAGYVTVVLELLDNTGRKRVFI
jgi:hypothetical protein